MSPPVMALLFLVIIIGLGFVGSKIMERLITDMLVVMDERKILEKYKTNGEHLIIYSLWYSVTSILSMTMIFVNLSALFVYLYGTGLELAGQLFLAASNAFVMVRLVNSSDGLKHVTTMGEEMGILQLPPEE